MVGEYLSLHEREVREVRAKAIDEFAERWKKELQGEHWTQFCTMRRMIDKIAEEMRGAE